MVFSSGVKNALISAFALNVLGVRKLHIQAISSRDMARDRARHQIGYGQSLTTTTPMVITMTIVATTAVQIAQSRILRQAYLAR
jgi:hypothetical protein